MNQIINSLFHLKRKTITILCFAIVLFSCSCSESTDIPKYEVSDDYCPNCKVCQPNVPASINPMLEASFSTEYIMCINITINPNDFEKMSKENRFKEGEYEFDEILRFFNDMKDNCDEAWPSEYNWYIANKIEVDGVSLKNVGVRKKGFMGSLNASFPSLKIKTDYYVEDLYLGATERITLNNNAADKTKMTTCLTYDLFRLAGYPAPRSNLANVMINGKPIGVYTHVEAVKKRFLERTFGNADGSLYEGAYTDFIEQWLPRWEIKTNKTDYDYNPLKNIIQALEKSDDDLYDALDRYLNVEQFITYWALEVLSGQFDGYSGGRNNFFVYFNPQDNDRAVFIPWGTDDTFNNTNTLDKFLIAEIPRRLAKIPQTREMMKDELVRLINEVWDEAYLLNQIDKYQEQIESVNEAIGFDAIVADLKEWVQNRKPFIESLLEQDFPLGNTETGVCSK